MGLYNFEIITKGKKATKCPEFLAQSVIIPWELKQSELASTYL